MYSGSAIVDLKAELSRKASEVDGKKNAEVNRLSRKNKTFQKVRFK